MLQAESEKLRQAWIQAVQASIASAYREITDNYYIEVRTHATVGGLSAYSQQAATVELTQTQKHWKLWQGRHT